MKKCFLSILIPNYNHAAYLPECLTSALQGSDENIEILVVDDGSTDNSIEVVESFIQKDSRIRLVKNPINRGVNVILNEGLRLIRGQYVFGLSADDHIFPSFFSEMVPFIRAHPEIDLCTSDFTYFENDKQGELQTVPLLKSCQKALVLSPGQTMKYFRSTSFWIPGNSSIMRVDLAIRHGGFHKEINQYSDFFLYHKIALNGFVGYLPKGVAAMRKLSTSYSERCFSDLKKQRATSKALLNLVLKDESRDLFAESTILRPIVKDLLLIAVFNPRYWRFLFPIFLKKVKKYSPKIFSALRVSL